LSSDAGRCCQQHIDWQITESDFEATPRRDLLALWLWISDVPVERAPMKILRESRPALGLLRALTRGHVAQPARTGRS